MRLGPGLALAAVGLGLATALIASLLPLREVVSTPPLQGLTEARPARLSRRAVVRRAAAFVALIAAAAGLAALPPLGDRPVWALLSSMLLLATLSVVAAPVLELLSRLRVGAASGARAPWLRIAQAALGAGRERAAWAATAVGVAVALAVSMTTMIGSFRSTVEAWTNEAMRADLFLRPAPSAAGLSTGRLDPRIVDVARELFGAQSVDAYHSAEARVGSQVVTVGGGELSVLAREGGVPFVDGRSAEVVYAEALANGAMVVNEPFARRFDVGVGDAVELETHRGPVTREIAGVFRDYSSHTGRAVLDRADFLALYPDEGPRNAAVFLPADEEPNAARARLLAALGSAFAVEVTLNREIRGEVMAIFERTFAVTGVLQLVALLVALLAMLTVLFALVNERRGELAVVRVLGGSRTQLHGIVLGEAALLGVVGAVGGLVIGLAVGWVLVKIVNVQSFGWSLAFEPPWASVLGTALGVLPVALLAGVLPAILAARSSPREVLRDDA